MKTTKHGELVFDQDDLCNLVMQGHDLVAMKTLLVDSGVNLETAAGVVDNMPEFIHYNDLVEQLSTEEFDHKNQQQWFMPQHYQNLDIAQHVLDLCVSNAELQRCGQELLMFQQRNLFDLLRYLKYLVDTMTQHGIIWGVGRGSSVSSFVLYKLGVHKINSLHYDLDPVEFLR